MRRDNITVLEWVDSLIGREIQMGREIESDTKTGREGVREGDRKTGSEGGSDRKTEWGEIWGDRKTK